MTRVMWVSLSITSHKKKCERMFFLFPTNHSGLAEQQWEKYVGNQWKKGANTKGLSMEP